MIMIAGTAFAAAAVTALILAPALLPWLRRMGAGQRIRSDGPRSHMKKAGTPTMGGLVFVPAVVIGLLLAQAATRETVVALGVMAGFAVIGWADDYLKVTRGKSLGLRARTKLLLSIIISVGLAYVVMSWSGSAVWVPIGNTVVDLGMWYVPFVVVVVVATTNAVNLTDGLDGLAAGLTVIAALGYAVVLWIIGGDLLLPFAVAVAGACAGFLPINWHPAAMFMGDTGSFALGGALAAIAVISGTELLLLLLGGVFVVETLSVMIQVVWFRLTGSRVLRMSPLHHHLELIGWEEKRVVSRLYVAGAVCAVVAVLIVFTL